MTYTRKQWIAILIILLITGCAQYDLKYSQRQFFEGYSAHLAAFNSLPKITQQYKIRVPEFELIVSSGPPACLKDGVRVSTAGCMGKSIELREGKLCGSIGYDYRVKCLTVRFI